MRGCGVMTCAACRMRWIVARDGQGRCSASRCQAMLVAPASSPAAAILVAGEELIDPLPGHPELRGRLGRAELLLHDGQDDHSGLRHTAECQRSRETPVKSQSSTITRDRCQRSRETRHPQLHFCTPRICGARSGSSPKRLAVEGRHWRKTGECVSAPRNRVRKFSS